MTSDPTQLKSKLSATIHQHAERLLEISQKIHQNPEIGFEEY